MSDPNENNKIPDAEREPVARPGFAARLRLAPEDTPLACVCMAVIALSAVTSKFLKHGPVAGRIVAYGAGLAALAYIIRRMRQGRPVMEAAFIVKAYAALAAIALAAGLAEAVLDLFGINL